MYSFVNLSGNKYGGYQSEKFTAEIDYDGFEFSECDDIDFDVHTDIAKKLEKILLGQKTSSDIRTKTTRWNKSYKTILYKGERISKLHITEIKNNWNNLDFSRTPWAKKIIALKEQYTNKLLKRRIKENNIKVRVFFSYLDNYNQRSGGFAVSPQVARWLAEQLINASQGALVNNGCSIRVKEDNILVGLKKKK